MAHGSGALLFPSMLLAAVVSLVGFVRGRRGERLIPSVGNAVMVVAAVWVSLFGF